MKRQVRLIALLAIVCACRDRDAKKTIAPAKIENASEEKKPAEPPSPARLAPVLREESEEGVGPRAITVELAEPLLEVAEVAPKGTVIELSPPLPGTIEHRTPST